VYMCWYCGSAVLDPEPLGRSTRCIDCGKDLRCCKSCRFYKPGSRGDCTETVDLTPPEKDRANFCDWFSLNPAFRKESTGESSARKASSAARSSFDSLFGA